MILLSVRKDNFFLTFSSSAKGQTTQTTPLVEARFEKTREFQTQILHWFSKSDNESNHHHMNVCIYVHVTTRVVSITKKKMSDEYIY